MPDFSAVEQAFERAVVEGIFPGAVLLVGREGELVYRRAFGHRSLEPERTPLAEDTIYDVSSLTKPLATTLAFLLLHREGKLRIDDPVTRVFHNFGVHGKTGVSFRHLLTHTSGLPAIRPYYREIDRLHRRGRVNFLCSRGAKDFVYEAIQREKPERRPGEKVVYSDLGFLLLGYAVETAAASTLDRFCLERIFRPFGLASTSFLDLSLLRVRRLIPMTERIAPTERCPWRKKILCGEVHDENAWAVGGVAGHAGLFASADDLHVLAQELVAAFHGMSERLLPSELVREMFRRDESVRGSTRTLGWDTPNRTKSAAGSRFSPQAVGHLGFTGTSIWIDLERAIHVILLSNRIHPRREPDRLRVFRPVAHDLVLSALGLP